MQKILKLCRKFLRVNGISVMLYFHRQILSIAFAGNKDRIPQKFLLRKFSLKYSKKLQFYFQGRNFCKENLVGKKKKGMKSGSYINLTEFICTSLLVFYGIYLGELKILYYKVSKLCKFNLLHKYQNLRMFQLQMFLTAIKALKRQEIRHVRLHSISSPR